ncbi:hypothetical protein QE152_g4768 [Popillia japonica]|uniref:CRAL-TRIO domain-containing protein n=1 Tax=Popillia japonica TaxID=7064 RepID=A0AAW1MX43_POPJA
MYVRSQLQDFAPEFVDFNDGDEHENAPSNPLTLHLHELHPRCRERAHRIAYFILHTTKWRVGDFEKMLTRTIMPILRRLMPFMRGFSVLHTPADMAMVNSVRGTA